MYENHAENRATYELHHASDVSLVDFSYLSILSPQCNRKVRNNDNEEQMKFLKYKHLPLCMRGSTQKASRVYILNIQRFFDACSGIHKASCMSMMMIMTAFSV